MNGTERHYEEYNIRVGHEHVILLIRTNEMTNLFFTNC